MLDMRRASSAKISELERALEEARAETQETRERLKVLQVTDLSLHISPFLYLLSLPLFLYLLSLPLFLLSTFSPLFLSLSLYLSTYYWYMVMW